MRKTSIIGSPSCFDKGCCSISRGPFKQLYGCTFVCVSSLMKEMTRIKFLGETLAVNNYRINNSLNSFVMAKTPNVNGIVESEEEAGVIRALYEVSVERMREGEVSCISHYIAECQWLTQRKKKHLYGFNSPVKLWSTEIESATFIPVKFITGRYEACKEELKFRIIILDIQI